jgi:hypothetical protein
MFIVKLDVLTNPPTRTHLNVVGGLASLNSSESYANGSLLPTGSPMLDRSTNWGLIKRFSTKGREGSSALGGSRPRGRKTLIKNPLAVGLKCSEGNHLKNHNMSCYQSSIVTTSGASEPQRSARVGGSGVKTGSNVAGPLRSSSSDRKGTGVVEEAPITLSITGAKNCGPRRRQRATWSPDVIIKSTTVRFM